MPFFLTDTEWIMIVVAAIYLFECVCWMRREAVCYSSLLGRFRALHAPAFMGNERMKLLVANPLPLARCFVCEPWPLAISPDGVYLTDGAWVTLDGTSTRHLAYDDIAGAVDVVEKEVCVGGRPIAACSTAAHARRLAAMLDEIAAAPAEERGKLIGGHLDRWTDNQAAALRYAELKKLVEPLRASGFMLFFLAFIVGPILYFEPYRLRWPVVACYFFMLFSIWMLAVWDYSVCRKRLLGESFSRRFRHVAMHLLSPAAAMRAGEVLVRDGLAEFHPLAAAAALCGKERLAALALPALLALEHPRPDELPREPAAARGDEWFRKKLLKRLVALLRRAEVDPDDLRRPPERLHNSLSYCPRCRNQYILAAGTCNDCGGLALVAYAGVSQSAEESSLKPEPQAR